MNKSQLQAIYNIGANETASQLLENAKNEGKSIAVRGAGVITDLRHSKADDSYMPLVSSVAKTLGLDVVLSDSMEDGINGQFERAMQRVTLNTKNKDAMFNTIFHEAFGEYMQAHNAAGASRVRSAILSYISDTKGSDYVSSMGKAYQRTEGTKTFNDALGEVVNDSIAGIFSTEEGIHDLRTWMDNKYDEKKSRGVLSDVADYFKGVAASLRNLIKEGHLTPASKNTAEMAESRARSIRKMILEEMDTAANNAANTTVDASTTGEANYSIAEKEYTDIINSIPVKHSLNMSDTVEQRKGILASQSEARFSIVVNDDGYQYVNVDVDQNRFEGLSNAEKQKEAAKVIREKFLGKIVGHKDGEAVVETKRGLSHYIYSQSTHDPNVVSNKMMASTELDNLLEISQFIDHVSYSDSIKEHPEALGGIDHYKTLFCVADNYYKGTITILNQERVKTLYDITRIKSIAPIEIPNEFSPISPEHDNALDKKSIAQKAQGSKKLSLVVDTQGKELTEGQRDYFKNAKTVDENGNLKVFYHGTARADRVGYTFRPDRATSGPMAFFTDNKDIANNYAKDKSDTSLSNDRRH